MDNLFQNVKPLFNNSKSLPNLEVELRLGKKNGTMFDTDIGEMKFNKIKTALDNFNDWEKVFQTNTTSYFHNSKRMDFDEDTGESKTIIKKRISKYDLILPNEPLDVRFSICQEIPTDGITDDADFMRCKSRTSYVRKNLSIDLTIVTGDQEDMDDESENKYEIEFEIIDPSKVTSDKLLYNIIYKIQCILKTL